MIKEYLEYIKGVRGLSSATIEGYRKDLQHFARWGISNGKTWHTLTERDCDLYLMDMERAGLKPATRNRRLSALRQLLSWAHHKGLLENNAARWCQAAKRGESLRKTMNVENIDRFLQEYTPSTAGFIAQLLVSLMLETGLRIGEAISIKIEDIDTAQQRIKVEGKGNKQRYVFYGDRTKKALSMFMTGNAAGRLLPDWSTQAFRSIIEEQLEPYCGKMHPHMLRHTFATEMLNNGMSITTLSHLMGHQKVETTQIYAKVATSTAQREYNQFKI